MNQIKRWMTLLAALALCVGLMTPVTPVRAEGMPITVTDLVGRKVEVVPGSYTRVVCIGAGALRMHSYIGDAALLCGVEDVDNTTLTERPKMFDKDPRPYVLAYGETFAALPSCGVGGPNAQAAEAEKILSCEPDIVISAYKDTDKEDALQEQLGVPVITIRSGSNGVFDDNFRQSLNLLGVIFGRENRAHELIDFIEEQTAAISNRVSAATVHPTAYVCGLGNWGTTNHLMTTPRYVPFDICGVVNAVTNTGTEGVQTIEAEKFAALGESMDMIFMDAAAVKNIAPLYKEDPTLFDTCKAWNNGKVYLQMAHNSYYTNYELELMNTWFIAKSVYPELFAEIDMADKTGEITTAFLGKDLSDDIFACPNSFGGYQTIDTATFFGE